MTGTGSKAGSRREARRAQQQSLGRNQLLDAAEEVFGQRGFYEATLRDVAELADFSVGSVYSFFENKEDLYWSVFLRRGEEYLPAMKKVIAEGGAALDRLHRLVDFEVSFFRRHPYFGQLYLHSTSPGIPTTAEPPSTGDLAGNFDTAMRLQADVIAAGQRSKEIRDGDPLVLARLLSGLVSAYHSVDPAVVYADAEAAELLPVTELHDIVERAFSRGEASPPAGARRSRSRT